MSPLQLRLKYKADTGFAPTNGKDTTIWGDPCNYKGRLNQKYAEWIENDHTEKRIRYKLNTGNSATFYKNNYTWFTKGYKEWLEENYCEVTTMMERLNIPYR